MPWVYTYPNAPREKRRWQDEVQRLTDVLNNLTAIEAGLTAETKVINNAATVTVPVLGDFLPVASRGDYRDVYETKAGEWLNDANDIKSRYININGELALRISNVQTEIANTNTLLSNANSQDSYWDAKSKVKHWED